MSDKELTPEELEQERVKAIEIAEQHRLNDIELIKNWGITYEFPEPFLQRDLQKYQTRLRKLGNKGDTAVSVYKGLVVRVGIELGWLKGDILTDIGGMTVGQITVLSGLVFNDIVLASQIPNE